MLNIIVRKFSHDFKVRSKTLLCKIDSIVVKLLVVFKSYEKGYRKVKPNKG